MTEEQPSSAFRFAISASFTADPLRRIIQFWGRQLESGFDVTIAPYNQLLQTLLDPNSDFAQNSHGLNVILVRLEDLGTEAKLESNVAHLIDEVRSAGPRLPSAILFCLCPPSSSEVSRQVRAKFEAAFDDSPGVHYMDYCDVERLYPVSEVHNPEGERLGRIPYSELYFAALGTSIVRYAHSLNRSPYKVFALDCDNTLWQGICGEDGPENVILDDPRLALHKFMLEQRESGMLLTLASKNNESDVLETFSKHPEFPLQLRHFVARRLNWEPKSANLTELAEELSLGLDSFIFIDDNPKECAELEGALPEVLSLPLPEDISRVPQFLNHIWAFDRPFITEEDRNRNTYYQQQQEFGAEIKRASSLDDFLATLELRVSIVPLELAKLERVSQLTQRTNQFNLTTSRRSEAEIHQALAEGYECYTVDVSDRFGEYGLVGVLIVRPLASQLDVDTFLLSCRALGRGVEHRMLAFLNHNAEGRGLESVKLNFSPTQKNSPARQFLESIGVLPPSTAAVPPKPKNLHGTPQSRRIDYLRVAQDLSRPEQIVAAMRQEHGRGLHEGLTSIEALLAGIWSELLERASVSRNDNFFDLGGHSLLAVLLLIRIKEEFGVELSIDDVYSGTLTLADLATRIEAAQLGALDLLAEIEAMSDEEVRELLAKEAG